MDNFLENVINGFLASVVLTSSLISVCSKRKSKSGKGVSVKNKSDEVPSRDTKKDEKKENIDATQSSKRGLKTQLHELQRVRSRQPSMSKDDAEKHQEVLARSRSRRKKKNADEESTQRSISLMGTPSVRRKSPRGSHRRTVENHISPEEAFQKYRRQESAKSTPIESYPLYSEKGPLEKVEETEKPKSHHLDKSKSKSGSSRRHSNKESLLKNPLGGLRKKTSKEMCGRTRSSKSAKSGGTKTDHKDGSTDANIHTARENSTHSKKKTSRRGRGSLRKALMDSVRTAIPINEGQKHKSELKTARSKEISSIKTNNSSLKGRSSKKEKSDKQKKDRSKRQLSGKSKSQATTNTQDDSGKHSTSSHSSNEQKKTRKRKNISHRKINTAKEKSSRQSIDNIDQTKTEPASTISPKTLLSSL